MQELFRHTWGRTRLHPCPGGQHARNWLAPQDGIAWTKPSRSRRTPVRRSTPRQRGPQRRLLPSIATHLGSPHPIAADDSPDDVLTRRFHSSYPDQIPANFEICQLPDDVISWLSVVLQMAASSLWDARKPATKTPTEPGEDGLGSSPLSDFPVTPFSLTYPSRSKAFSPSLSSRPSEPSTGQEQVYLPACILTAQSGMAKSK